MKYTISAYTTTRNASEMNYPFEESIRSMLQFSDEVVVLDTSDGEDDTITRLDALASQDKRVKVFYANKLVDWMAPNHGVFDGQTKAMARSRCTGDFLWQFDTDEVVHELDAPKIRPFVEKLNFLQQCPLVALPVVEYWGSQGKVRMDINPWKWRLSRNLPDITHGIPIHLRKTINGLLYASHGTDGCDYISKTTGNPQPCLGFVPEQVEQLRQFAINTSHQGAVTQYQTWFNNTISELPGVNHYSWISIPRKIRRYRMFWTTFWKSLYNEDKDPEKNPFFNEPWSKVTEEMIVLRGKELEEKTGGHIFHNPWKGNTVPHISVTREHPAIIKPWIAANT